ncbi:MAG: hypothetical protein OEW46_05430, partial [Actinomycetota bacterium]|nr:hypothetical protein [Actinomycetota bacterium]
MSSALRHIALVIVAAVLTWSLPASLSAPAAAAGTWMPPAYLMWRTGGLPHGLTPKLDALQGTEHVVVVAGDTLWMKRSVRADGRIVDRAQGRYRIPIEVMATSRRDLAPFLPGAWRDTVVKAMGRGRGVLGESSAGLRTLRVGDRMVFPGGRVTVGAIVPDEVVAWSEVFVSREKGRDLGVKHDRFALLQMRKHPTEAELARRIAALLGPGYPPRVRRPGHAQFRLYGDAL